ncbi:NPCBM/NEW2 domain-containing protein [Deinococcus sp. YIM 134068]|uniref:NPCBM/NEW2 domain-containing protein n=1 Tax=Deinococcus lichenicola TaxID=3118910 RepID=UPI002F939EF2
MHTRFTLTLPTLTLTTLALTLAACGSTPAPTEAATTSGGLLHAASLGETSPTVGVSAGTQVLSTRPFASATNGWGPAERDRSNGERAAGDGTTLTLGGKTYSRGLGTHAPSALAFDLDGQCQTFTADIGVDDEVSGGSVTFQVIADGQVLYDSGVTRGADAARSLKVGVAGRKQLKLVVTDAGDGASFDHADWAEPTLSDCAPTTAAVAAGAEADVVYQGPLVITRGGTYSGNWQSLDPRVPAVSIRTSEPVVIENSRLRGRGNLIEGFHTRVTIRNNHGHGLNPEVAGRSPGRFINLEEVYDVRVENNVFEGTSGIYFRQYRGDAGRGETIKVLRNVARNVDGRKSDGQGGYSTSAFNWAQFVQFNDVTRIADAEIAWNQVINEPGRSRVEDNINLYVSSGTPQSPIRIHDNYIQGAYNALPATDAKFSGGGILVGDGKVSDPARIGYAHVSHNQVVGTTNYGIAIAGGSGSVLEHNRVVSSGRLPDGSPIAAQNVGMYMWDPYGGAKQSPATFGHNRALYNVVGWTRVRGDKVDSNAYWWPAKGLNGSVTVSTTNLGTAVNLDVERAEFGRWQTKLTQAGVRIGVQ